MVTVYEWCAGLPTLRLLVTLRLLTCLRLLLSLHSQFNGHIGTAIGKGFNWI
jgi:hypothetical protein